MKTNLFDLQVTDFNYNMKHKLSHFIQHMNNSTFIYSTQHIYSTNSVHDLARKLMYFKIHLLASQTEALGTKSSSLRGEETVNDTI